MEFTGKVAGLTKDFSTNKYTISFEVNEPSVIKAHFDDINNIDKLNIKATRYRAKRSIDANNYFHVLVGKIAEALGISKAKCKNVLICKYGQPQLLDDSSPMIYKTNAPEDFMWEQESLHCIPIKYEDKATFYKVYRGSHTYDTHEMSKLIDGTVADAKELDIETMTPDEIERMKASWKA